MAPDNRNAQRRIKLSIENLLRLGCFERSTKGPLEHSKTAYGILEEAVSTTATGMLIRRGSNRGPIVFPPCGPMQDRSASHDSLRTSELNGRYVLGTCPERITTGVSGSSTVGSGA